MWGEARGRVEPAKKSHRIRTGCPSTLSHVKCFNAAPAFPCPHPVLRRHSLFRFFRSHARFRYSARLLIAALPRSRTAPMRTVTALFGSPYHQQHFTDSTKPFFLSNGYTPYIHPTRTLCLSISFSLSLSLVIHPLSPLANLTIFNSVHPDSLPRKNTRTLSATNVNC